MRIFAAVRNFFFDEEDTPKKRIYDPDQVTMVNAADLFPIQMMSDADTMKSIIQRQKTDDEIEKKVTMEFMEEVKKQKAALNQPKPESVATDEAKLSWLDGVDDRL